MTTVFVAGATGVVGRRTVAALVAAGHAVTGVARSETKAALLRSLGASAAAIDLFDPAAVKEAVVGHEVVCNLATHIPPPSEASRPHAWEENRRLRSEASGHLVDAALAAGAGRYIQESITFVYADGGDRWLTEDDPVDVPAWAASTIDAEGQAARFTAEGGAGVVLRFGLFYGPDSHPSTVVAAPGWISSISTDDAAAAVVAALAVPPGTYNVVDDEPVLRTAYPGARPADAVVLNPLLLRSQRVSNGRFKAASGWAPRDRNVVEGHERLGMAV